MLRDARGRTVVRLRASAEGEGGAAKLRAALQKLWPLAETSLVESAIDGSAIAQIVVPSEDEEWHKSHARAASSAFARITAGVALLLLAAGVALELRAFSADEL